MQLSFSTVAYFTGCTGEQLETIRESFDSFADGQENVCVTMEQLSERINELESNLIDQAVQFEKTGIEEQKEYRFLKEIQSEIKRRKQSVGDIIFSR